MSKVRVLKVPAAAYDPDRPVSSLLKSQIQQLQVAVLHAVDTEREASDCISTLNRLLVRLRPHIAPSPHRAVAKKKPGRKKAGAKKTAGARKKR